MNLFNRYQQQAPGAGGDTPPAGTPPATPPPGETPPSGPLSQAGVWEYAEGVAGEGDRPEYLNSKYKSVAEQAKAWTELSEMQGKWGTNFGAPEGDYELTLPSGVTGKFDLEDPLLISVRAEAKEIGLSQEGFNRLLHKYVEHSASMIDDHDAQVARVTSELGENGSQILSDLWARLSKILPAEQAKALDSIVTSTDGIKALQSLVTAEAVLPAGGADHVGGVSKEELKALRHQTFPDDHPQKGKQMYGTAAAEEHTKKVDELYKQLYPGEDITVVG